MHVISGVHSAFLEDYIASELSTDVDGVASISRFAVILADRIRSAYPTCSVEVRCDLNILDGLPWDHQTHVLDPLPGVFVADVVREIEALRRSIQNHEWLMYRSDMHEPRMPYPSAGMEYQEPSSV
jgi:hypothetical protein